jgi:hypothetical protein
VVGKQRSGRGSTRRKMNELAKKVLKPIREKVSADRMRFEDGEYNLDLAYILPNIIGKDDSSPSLSSSSSFVLSFVSLLFVFHLLSY